MKSFAITGVTRTGNMGGAAMLAAAIEGLSARSPGATFSLLSIKPAADRAAVSDDLAIVDARPGRLILLYLPLAVLAWPFARLPAVRRWLSRIGYFRALIEADAVIDLCGIAFVDRRGLPLLIYNVACCLPAIAVGTPVAKLAQAMGPFRTPLNRWAARFVLDRCAVVVARGAATLEYLHDAGIPDAVNLPDVSFALDVGPASKAAAIALLGPATADRPLLIVSPSEVVRRLKQGSGEPLADAFIGLLQRCIDEGWRVAIVPHSFGGSGSKNNDLEICRAVANGLDPQHAALIQADEDPRLLRALLGQAEVFIGCRFHSVVGALAMGVPTLTIGWSHKYREMVEPLQPGDWTLDWRDFDVETAFRRFQDLAASRSAVAATIRQRLADVRRDAGRNFDLALAAVRS